MTFKWILMLAGLLVPAGIWAQVGAVTLSGVIKEKGSKQPIPYVSVVLARRTDSAFAAGTMTAGDGRFSLPGIAPGQYLLHCSFSGYTSLWEPVYLGNKSAFIDLGTLSLPPAADTLDQVTVTAKSQQVSSRMDKKVVSVADNIAQSGGSVLQAMQNLPGVTVQDGKLFIRGSDKIAVLLDGKQTALTGFGSQTSLDNIPASAIDKIEIINNPAARYDANGNAGIINIIFRKNKQEGFSGKAGMMAGVGAIWEKQENLPGIRPQFQATPKLIPSLALNYRKKDWNVFFQGDVFYNPTLNKNEFVTRVFDDGTVIQHQTKRNRETTFTTLRSGADWSINNNDQLSAAILYSSEKIIDNGDQPYFKGDLSEPLRLWTFLEDELKTTVTATTSFQHKFPEPGRVLNLGYNYTFHREDEKYFFTNQMPTYTGQDAFKLLSDEHVNDFTADYMHPVRHGRVEAGLKYRLRRIPTNMDFYPGLNSPLDSNAGGWATYSENIPAFYGNYLFENSRYELEAGLRVEYVRVNYDVDPNHNTYESDGYNYTQPFPSFRGAWKMNERQKLSVFYNRRVDRPNEFDIRVFPKYDEAEIVKVGNPALRPQFTQSFELGYKSSFGNSYLYAALYHRIAEGTITRIATTEPGGTIIYNVMQNAGKSYNTGVEMLFNADVSKRFSFNINLNGYHNKIDSFSVVNLYPQPSPFSAREASIYSGNIKWNGFFHFGGQLDAQVTALYQAPDLIPQGRVGARFSLDIGLKKQIQKNKGELFLNATDLLNTMVIEKEIDGQGFSYTSRDYYETQVIRAGYNYKF